MTDLLLPPPGQTLVFRPYGFLAAPFSINTSGDHMIIPGVSEQVIYVFGLVSLHAGAVSLTMKSNTTLLSGPMFCAGLLLDRQTEAYYTTGVGESFVINLDNNIQCGGTIWYQVQ